MKSFRAVYDGGMYAYQGRFKVHVIGYRKMFSHRVNMPTGVPCVFIHIFHDDVDVGTTEGIKSIPANTIVVFEPGKLLYLGRTDRSWSHSWIRCSGTIVNKIFSENGIKYNTPMVFDSVEENLKYLLAIHEEMHHPRGVILENAEDLFKIWMRNIRRIQDYSDKPKVPTSFLKAKQFIEINYLKSITLDDIAKAGNLSKSHLCKGFHSHFDISPVNYAIKLKLLDAAELLQGANLNITEVAEKCGFSDVFYFSKMFKKYMGVSPRNYRV